MRDDELRRLERWDRRDPHLSTIIANHRPIICPHGPLSVAIAIHALTQR